MLENNLLEFGPKCLHASLWIEEAKVSHTSALLPLHEGSTCLLDPTDRPTLMCISQTPPHHPSTSFLPQPQLFSSPWESACMGNGSRHDPSTWFLVPSQLREQGNQNIRVSISTPGKWAQCFCPWLNHLILQLTIHLLSH